MRPILVFWLAGLTVEITQFGLWWGGTKDRSLAAVRAYWHDKVGDLLIIAPVGGLFCVLWAWGTLDAIAAKIPDSLRDGIATGTGVPFTPQVGLFVGGLLALRPSDFVRAGVAAASVPVRGVASLLVKPPAGG